MSKKLTSGQELITLQKTLKLLKQLYDNNPKYAYKKAINELTIETNNLNKKK